MKKKLIGSIDDFTLDLAKFYEKVKTRKEVIKLIKFTSYGLLTLEKFKQRLDSDLQNKVCEISDIDFDPSVDIEVKDFTEEAKKAIEGIKGITYCESHKTITITLDLTENMFKKIIEEEALKVYKDVIQKAYNELKEKTK